MLKIEYSEKFLKKVSKIRDNIIKEQAKKQIRKIIENPEVGKPMKYARKGTRELYLKPFRISYSYDKHARKIILLEFYHKDEQ
jgi:mRNA-degrading endonuclease RelE of RelBE toxin-antitoxin system